MRALIFAVLLSACGQPAQTVTTSTAAAASDTSVPADASDAMPAPAWEDARAAGVDFRAVGQEPGWILNIYRRDKITLAWNYADQQAQFPLSAPTSPEEGLTRYETHTNEHTLTIDIRRFPCQDAMSGAAYPASVTVHIDDSTLEGCGRSI